MVEGALCDIALVATTAMALAGEAAVSAGVLIGSTVAAVALAGPILSLEAGRARVSSGGIIANLALVVALPKLWSASPPAPAPKFLRRKAARRVLRRGRYRCSRRRRLPLGTPRVVGVGSWTALAAVAALVALDRGRASGCRPPTGNPPPPCSFFLVASPAAAPRRPCLGARAARPTATARAMISMRDFAIAAWVAPPPPAWPPPPPSASTASPSWSRAPRWPASCASAPPNRRRKPVIQHRFDRTDPDSAPQQNSPSKSWYSANSCHTVHVNLRTQARWIVSAPGYLGVIGVGPAIGRHHPRDSEIRDAQATGLRK